MSTKSREIQPEAATAAPPAQDKTAPRTIHTGPFKVVENAFRKNLIEGRNYGVGFCWCNHQGDTLTQINPISPCKDYMNDIVWSERTGKSGVFYNFSASPRGIWKGQDHGVLMISVLDFFSGCPYERKAKEIAYLEDHHDSVAKFLNHFEGIISKATGRTINPTQSVRVAKNQYAFFIDLFWTEQTYLISIYCNFLRLAVEGSYGISGERDHVNFLKGSPFPDAIILRSAWNKVEAVLAGKIPPCGWDGMFFNPHVAGIYGVSSSLFVSNKAESKKAD